MAVFSVATAEDREALSCAMLEVRTSISLWRALATLEVSFESKSELDTVASIVVKSPIKVVLAFCSLVTACCRSSTSLASASERFVIELKSEESLAISDANGPIVIPAVCSASTMVVSAAV